MTALPRAFSLLGLLLATAMLIGVGYLTHLSLMFLIRYALTMDDSLGQSHFGRR